MTESVLSTASEAKANRLDPPHDLLSASEDKSSNGSWMAFAGRDPSITTQQVDRQASELLSYVQEQNKEIDVRQAELNAKLAQLDNQLRNARLRSNSSVGVDLIPEESTSKENVRQTPADESMLDSGLDLEAYGKNEPSTVAPEEPAADVGAVRIESVEPYVAEIEYVQQEVDVRINHFHSAHTEHTSQEFDEVEKLVAQFTSLDMDLDSNEAVEQIEEVFATDEAIADEETNVIEEPIAAEEVFHVEEELDVEEEIVTDGLIIAAPIAAEEVADEETIFEEDPLAVAVAEPVMPPPETPVPKPREHVDAFPKLLAESHLDRVDSMHAGTTSSSELESERRLLAEKKLELDRRKSVLSRMQEETQALHREALEMRLVTEQLWGQLSETTPPEQLSDLIASLRARLDQEYTNEQTTLEDRKRELLSVQSLLEKKQVALREQSSKLHDWFAIRQEEIKSFATEIDAREMLLDRREHRMQDEFAKWEAQRRDYERQLKGLSQKLQLDGLK